MVNFDVFEQRVIILSGYKCNSFQPCTSIYLVFYQKLIGQFKNLFFVLLIRCWRYRVMASFSRFLNLLKASRWIFILSKRVALLLRKVSSQSKGSLALATRNFKDTILASINRQVFTLSKTHGLWLCQRTLLVFLLRKLS